MTESCADCRRDDDHCHDLLLVHVDGSLECTSGPGCTTRREIHAWLLACAEAVGDCGCGALAEREHAA